MVHAALDAGINFFDTADIYGKSGLSEEYLGRALGSRRSEIVLATKFGMKMDEQRKERGRSTSARQRRTACAALGTDVIDLYQLHQPGPEVPIAETLGALDELVRAGKVREIGCSNFSVEQLREAETAARDRGTARFVSVQNEYSLFEREPENGRACRMRAAGTGLPPLLPTGQRPPHRQVLRKVSRCSQGTRLSGERFAGLLSEENLTVVERLTAFAESRGHTLLELAFSWLLARPVVSSVIAGATSPRQIAANAAAAGWRMTEQDLAEIDSISRAGQVDGRA